LGSFHDMPPGPGMMTAPFPGGMMGPRDVMQVRITVFEHICVFYYFITIRDRHFLLVHLILECLHLLKRISHHFHHKGLVLCLLLDRCHHRDSHHGLVDQDRHSIRYMLWKHVISRYVSYSAP
jgi:hypothetical protein